MKKKMKNGTGLSCRKFDAEKRYVGIDFSGIEENEGMQEEGHCFRNDASIFFYASSSYFASFHLISQQIDKAFEKAERKTVERLILPYYFNFRHYLELELKALIIGLKDGVDFIPSSIYLSAVEAKLRTEMGAERMLAEVLAPIRDRYDYVLVDTAPSLGMLTVNALAAADEVVITVNPQLLAMMGLQDFLRTVGKIKKRINPKLTIAGILLTMCDGRTTLCKVLTEEVTVSFQGQIKIFKNRIPSTVKVGESIYYSMPIALYSKKASAGIAYRKFAKELIDYEG